MESYYHGNAPLRLKVDFTPLNAFLFYQNVLALISQAERDALKQCTFGLYNNARQYTENRWYKSSFPADETEVSPAVLSALSPNADENHDFFSGSDSSYVIGKVEHTTDDDWDPKIGL